MATNTKSTKKTAKKTNNKKIPHLYKENNPDYHKISGKFVGLYIMFAVTTVVFAAMAVWLFFFASEVLNKYEAIDATCRNGKCQVIINSDDAGSTDAGEQE